MSLIGITGAIGAGKSTVLGFFAELGCATWDADEAVHRLYRPDGPVVHAMVARWGSQATLPDGSVNRPWVSDRVFQVAAERLWLEVLVHPLVRQDMLAFHTKADGLLLCAVPLLYEVQWETPFARVIAVWCAESTRRERLLRRGWTLESIASRDQAQLSADDKLKRADFAIITDGTLECTRRQCEQLWPRVSLCREK
jgi:dephospho-CoA kinase